MYSSGFALRLEIELAILAAFYRISLAGHLLHPQSQERAGHRNELYGHAGKSMASTRLRIYVALGGIGFVYGIFKGANGGKRVRIGCTRRMSAG